MAYAEKVYKVRGGKQTKQFTWRCKYKAPVGHTPAWLTEPGFPTKRTAEEWGAEQEAAIRAGVWIDPKKMRTPFGEFARIFMAARQKRGRTNGTRWDLLEGHIFPKWEHTPLMTVTWFDVDTWQMGIKDSTKAGHCVSLMSTILTGAVDARYLVMNPLAGRRRTRPTVTVPSARPQRSDEEKWARAEVVLRVADRLGPAVGLHVLTTAFTGLNWGESTGLHRDYVLLTRRQEHEGGTWECPVIRVVQELAEYTKRAPDGTKLGQVLGLEPPKNEYRERDIDVPPFLAELLRAHLDDWPHDFVFSTPDGKFWRNSNFSRRQLRPAADGRDALPAVRGHAPREKWEPIQTGLTMRALRHSHDTYQDQIGVRPALEFEQAGHKRPGIKRIYQHPTVEMRKERLDGLQEIYERAMRTLGWRTLWGRVDLKKHPADAISQIAPK
ncbi:hypothetical protein GPA10_24815 [Streptomyces sp. p1417]|uniref:Phage integrase family protein n=1 Tax=Streptomyces typhae TaxID=2681492 RepID=A0A6L6X2M0_9ACTN|nr:hypothetical protein [Streptomyces typhae]MVO87890.1 hypothetical protein [Streptomyces typhae]